jgi:hypothetical protein
MGGALAGSQENRWLTPPCYCTANPFISLQVAKPRPSCLPLLHCNPRFLFSCEGFFESNFGLNFKRADHWRPKEKEETVPSLVRSPVREQLSCPFARASTSVWLQEFGDARTDESVAEHERSNQRLPRGKRQQRPRARESLTVGDQPATGSGFGCGYALDGYLA